MELDPKLEKDIISYCEANGLTVSEYASRLLKEAFMRDKYGDRPPLFGASSVTTKNEEPPAVSDDPAPVKKEEKKVVRKRKKTPEPADETPPQVKVTETPEKGEDEKKENVKPKRRKLS